VRRALSFDTSDSDGIGPSKRRRYEAASAAAAMTDSQLQAAAYGADSTYGEMVALSRLE